MRKICLKSIFCLVSIIMTTSLIAGVQEGIAAINAGDYDAAYAEFSKLAENGDSKAMVTIGTWYLNGQGFEQDYSKAMVWYLKAFAENNPDSMNNIGVMYRDGLGVTQDLEIAYALFHLTIKNTDSDDILARVDRNLNTLDNIITKDQINRAEVLLKDGLTAKKLKEHKTEKSAARQQINLLPKDIFDTIPDTYKLTNNNARSKVNIVSVYNDSYEEMPGFVGFSGEAVEDTNGIIIDSQYICKDGRFSVIVPKLSFGNIVIRQTVFRGGVDHQVRFFEEGSDPTIPWIVNKNYGHAAVSTTKLPKEWENKEKDVLKIIQEMQLGFVMSLPEDYYRCTLISGQSGDVFQTVVLNRIPSMMYPQTDVKICPPREGLKTLGINRLFFKDCVLVELALILSRPDDMPEGEFINDCVNQMDAFMSGFELLKELQAKQSTHQTEY